MVVQAKIKPIMAATMGSQFEEAIIHTLMFEGGYVLDPNDPGGETNFGISKRAYPDLDIKNLTERRAREIYQADYWYPMRLDTLNCQMIANNLFDFAVHHGVRGATKKLQFTMAKHFGFSGGIDGVMGSATLGFATELILSGQGSAFALHQLLIKQRIEFYLATAKSEYLKGFIARASYFL